ncbi:MAG: hypothetical protein IIC56_06765 [Proteobacteria bacterium]|nr:hypothetical protein [Pseudomonadota bacterium]
MDEYPIPAAPQYDGRSSTVIVFLSLFLLILAFFIVLVTISTFEKVKSKAVMSSVTTAFTTNLPPRTDPTTDFTAKEGDVLAGQAFQERITGVFATTMQVAKVKIVKPGRMMRAEMPSSAIFFEGEGRIRPNAVPFLDRIVAALSGRPPGLRFDMEFVIGTAYNDDNVLPIGQTLEMARAGAFAREMVSRGAPPDSVSIGLAPGDREQITIRFYVRDLDEIRLGFPGTERNGQR